MEIVYGCGYGTRPKVGRSVRVRSSNNSTRSTRQQEPVKKENHISRTTKWEIVSPGLHSFPSSWRWSPSLSPYTPFSPSYPLLLSLRVGDRIIQLPFVWRLLIPSCIENVTHCPRVYIGNSISTTSVSLLFSVVNSGSINRYFIFLHLLLDRPLGM